MWDGTLDLKLMLDDTARAYKRAGFAVNTRHFTMSFPAVQIGVTDGLPVRVQVSQEAFFVALAFSCATLDLDHFPNVMDFFAGIALQITDESSGYKFLSRDRVMPHQFISGSDGAPFILGFPYVLPPGGSLLLNSRHSGEQGVLNVSVIGALLYTNPYTRTVILPDVPGEEAV